MDLDPTLATLIANGHYAVAADRYEEQTGDTHLATLMRIEGLDWELEDGSPELKIRLKYHEQAKNGWWTGQCGRHRLGGGVLGCSPFCRPDSLAEIGVIEVLKSACFSGDLSLGNPLVSRFYELACRATERYAEETA